MSVFSDVLFISVIVILVLTLFRRSAIWGGATAGLIIGGLFGLFTGDIFSGIKNGVTIGGVIGIVAEILGIVSDRIRQRN